MTQRKAAAAPASAIPDPIFALIEEHQAAFELSNRLSHGDDDDPEWLESIDMEMRLWKRLVGTEPETVAGVASFCRVRRLLPGGGRR
jgi:hypothetical protein